MKRMLIAVGSALLMAAMAGRAENPIVQTHFSPDPAPMVHKGTLYVYAGDDIPGYDFYYMTKWRVFSTTDMVNWTDYGVPISLETFTWARDRAWAAQCVERDGKFYWYICAQTDKNDMSIGVAVSDSPIGPFKDAIGKPLIQNGSWSNIDPTVYIDDDGQAYMYWGNGSLFYVKLNKDMISYSGEIETVPLTVETFGGTRGRRGPAAQGAPPAQENVDAFVEGPWFFKRNNKYYMLFAGMNRGTETLSYSMSTGPTGPWKYQGKIMVDQDLNSFTNHGGVIDYKGHSYLFYHTGWLPQGGSYGRASSVEEFTYKADGTIPPVLATREGPKPIGTLNPYQRTEAETMAWSEKCTIAQNDKVGVYITGVRGKGFIKVREVDFGSTSPASFTASMAAGVDGGILEVRVDSIKGDLIASIDLTRTGGWEEFKPFTKPLSKSVTGKHDLYFVFNSHNITAGRELFNFDHWVFNKR